MALDGDEAFAYWDDGEGIVRRSLDRDDAAEERVVSARTVRRVFAATVAGDAAVAWVQRTLETGRSAYYLRWRGDTRLVESTLLQNPLALGAGPDGPALLLVRRSGSEAHLDLYRWSGEIVRVRSSDRDIAGPSLAFDEGGGAVVSWLEGEVRRSEFGTESEWDAYAAFVTAEGRAGTANLLGDAARDGIQFVSRVDLGPDGAQVSWTDSEGALLVARPGRAPQEVGRGFPIGVFGGDLYWSEGTSIRRRSAASGQPDAQGESVVWSPNEPEQAVGLEHGGHLHLVWYGGNIGGGFAVYGASDRSPIRLGWRDHLAARMGWHPWNFWQAFGGQALVSVLIGVLVTVALSPLLLVAALLLSRTLRPGRGTAAGLILSGTALLGLLAISAWQAARLAFPGGLAALFGTWEIALALGIGAGVSWLLRRNADSEMVFEIVASAGISAVLTLALLAFLHFRAWTELWGGLL